jgi:hypothetical protein
MEDVPSSRWFRLYFLAPVNAISTTCQTSRRLGKKCDEQQRSLGCCPRSWCSSRRLAVSWALCVSDIKPYWYPYTSVLEVDGLQMSRKFVVRSATRIIILGSRAEVVRWSSHKIIWMGQVAAGPLKPFSHCLSAWGMVRGKSDSGTEVGSLRSATVFCLSVHCYSVAFFRGTFTNNNYFVS